MASTSQERHPCYLCEKTFKSSMLLNRHIRNHEDIRPHSCDQCEKKFKTKTHLKEHQRSHSGERPFQCADCMSTFKTHSQLRLHKYVHINASKASKLPKVNNVGDQLSSSESEEDEELRKNRRFPCQVEGCGKAFRFATHRKTHMIVHQEERPFKCDECDKSFKSSASLCGHKVTHLEPTFVCNKCDRKFLTAEYLKMHEDVHTGEPPIMCYPCKESFETESLLKRHMDMHVMRDAAKALKKKRIRPKRTRRVSEDPKEAQPVRTAEPNEKRVKPDPEEERPVIATTVSEDREPVPIAEIQIEPQPSTSEITIMEDKALHPVVARTIPETSKQELKDTQPSSSQFTVMSVSGSQEDLRSSIHVPQGVQQTPETQILQSVLTTIIPESSQMTPTEPQPLTSSFTPMFTALPQVDTSPAAQGAENVQQMPLQAINRQITAAQWQQYCNMMWRPNNIPYANYYYNPYPVYHPYRPNLHMFPGHTVHPSMVQSPSAAATKQPTTATNSTGLNQHFRFHLKDKRYSCSFPGCFKTFTQKSQVDQHERIHSGDRPYVCKYCDKDFKQQSQVIVHERLHTGEKPYKCNFCEMAFRQLSSQQFHERKFHTITRPSNEPLPSPQTLPPVAPGTPLLGRRLAALKLKEEANTESAPDADVPKIEEAPCSSTMATDLPGSRNEPVIDTGLTTTSLKSCKGPASKNSAKPNCLQEATEPESDNPVTSKASEAVVETKEESLMSYSLRSRITPDKPADHPGTSRGSDYFAQLGILIEECKKYYGKFEIPIKNIRFPRNYNVKCESVMKRRATQLVSNGKIWEEGLLNGLVGIISSDDIGDVTEKAYVLLLENHGLIAALKTIKKDKRLLDASPEWLQASNPVFPIEIVAVPNNIFDACSHELTSAGKAEIRAAMTVVLHEENEASDHLTLKTLRTVVDASNRHKAIAENCWSCFMEGQPASTMSQKRWRYIFLVVCAPEALFNEFLLMAKRNSKRTVPEDEESGRFLKWEVLKPLLLQVRSNKDKMDTVVNALQQMNGYEHAAKQTELVILLEMILANPEECVAPKLRSRRGSKNKRSDKEYLPPAQADPKAATTSSSLGKRKSNGSRAGSNGSEKVPEPSIVAEAPIISPPRAHSAAQEATPIIHIGNCSPANTDSTGVSILEDKKADAEIVTVEMNADKNLPAPPSDSIEELPAPPTISPLPADQDFSLLAERCYPPVPDQSDDIYIVDESGRNQSVRKQVTTEAKTEPMKEPAKTSTLPNSSSCLIEMPKPAPMTDVAGPSGVSRKTTAVPETIEIDDDDDDDDDDEITVVDTFTKPTLAQKPPAQVDNNNVSPPESMISNLTSASRMMPNVSVSMDINMTGSVVSVVGGAEMTKTPLSTTIFLRAQSHPDEMMLIWAQELEVDVLTSANTYPGQCILVVEKIDSTNDNTQLRDMLLASGFTTVRVSMLGPESTVITWTILSFDKNISKEKHNKLINSFSEIERIGVDLAKTKNMKLVHITRWNKEGIFKTLASRLRRSVIACNYIQESL